MKVVIFGRGKVGRTLARLLRAASVEVSLRPGRSLMRGAIAPDRIFVLAVPDADIQACAQRLAPHVSRKSVVLHCAGARTPTELTACAERGAATAGLHPLVSFASARSLPNLHGATFVAHGVPKATRSAAAMCRKLGARCVVQPMLGPAYHAAAALTANGTAALAYSAQNVLVELGMKPHEAAVALAGLLQTVAANIAQVGLPQALTGPVVRGDHATVRRHIAALSELSPALASDYQGVQPIIESCARAAWKQTKRQRQR